MPALRTSSPAPKVVFDGLIYWFTEKFDPDDDRCCCCRGPISEDSVPLMLFRDVRVVGARTKQTWLARFCEKCSQALLCARIR